MHLDHSMFAHVQSNRDCWNLRSIFVELFQNGRVLTNISYSISLIIENDALLSFMSRFTHLARINVQAKS
jgi:hypothetical protein